MVIYPRPFRFWVIAVLPVVLAPPLVGACGTTAGSSPSAAQSSAPDTTARSESPTESASATPAGGLAVPGEASPVAAVFVQPGSGGGSLTLTGIACNGPRGDWTMAAMLDGVVSGNAVTTFSLSSGQAPVTYSIPIEIEGVSGTQDFNGTVTLGDNDTTLSAAGTTEVTLELPYVGDMGSQSSDLVLDVPVIDDPSTMLTWAAFDGGPGTDSITLNDACAELAALTD